ncbi:MAG TPA: hypothetical protein VI653_15785 [Steroidobacteraceae bacterium]
MSASYPRFFSAGAALLLVLTLPAAGDALAYSGITNLVYLSDEDKLQGFSATDKDPGDADATESCIDWVTDEAGNTFCDETLYVENWVAVTAQVYNVAGTLVYSGSDTDFAAAVNEYTLPVQLGYFLDTRAHGIHYLEQDFYFGSLDANGFWFYSYAGTNVYQLGETEKIARAIPVCNQASIDSVSVNTALQWTAAEPWERAATIACAVGPNSPTALNFNDSFAQIYPNFASTNDPCATLTYQNSPFVGAVHKHPYFQSAAEYTRGNGCRKDKNPPTVSQLNQLNILNQDFSDGDKSAYRNSGQPFYLRVPLGNAVKRLLNNTTTGVWP